VLGTFLLSNLTAAAAEGGIASVALTVHQSFIRNGEAVPIDRTITYEMRPLEHGNPMPTGSVSGVYTFSITDTAQAQIAPIVFPGAGVYNYEIVVTSHDILGLRTDSRVYAVEILAAFDGRSAYNIFVNGEKTDRISFEHIIETVTISGRKTWNHGVLPQHYHPQYIVVLVMNGDDVVVRQTVTQAEHWSWSFTLPRYDGDREIVYRISEEIVPGYSVRVDGYNLINTFDRNNPNIPPEWELPLTGDDSNIMLWRILLTISAAGMVFVVFIGMRRKKKDELAES